MFSEILALGETGSVTEQLFPFTKVLSDAAGGHKTVGLVWSGPGGEQDGWFQVRGSEGAGSAHVRVTLCLLKAQTNVAQLRLLGRLLKTSSFQRLRSTH